MKKLVIPGLLNLIILLLAISIHAQPPTIIWDDFFPGSGDYELGNYTANDIKENPHGGYVLVGTRRIAATNGYNELMLMRVDEVGDAIRMDAGETHGETNVDGVPWDQYAYDMIITSDYPHVSYLVTGFRDTTLTGARTPPGLLLMEIWGNGSVLFDTLYYNNNQHHIHGRCIQPAIEGGYIIAGSIREDGGGIEKIMMARVAKNKDGKYDIVSNPLIKINPVGENGYASWIRPFGDGYLLAGTANKGGDKEGDVNYDLFIQKVDKDRYEEWTTFYGTPNNDEFADAVLSGDTIFLAGSAEVPVEGSAYEYNQIYIVKAGPNGDIIWEKTYGGPTTHYANKIIRTGDGNLLVAGTAIVSHHAQMVLLKIDATTGDSLWMQSYGTNYTDAGIRDIIRTSDFNYLVAGRASSSSTQDPRVYVMKLANPQTANLFMAKEGLNLDIVTTTPTKDVINVTADKVMFYGVSVTIDSLLHPSVGDLEITLEHGGTTVTLVDRPENSGENFIRTGFIDAAELSLNLRFAPYSGWYRPEEPLFPFLLDDPTGEWTLTVTDHGTGGLKSTTRILNEWSLNLLVESGTGTGVHPAESMENFGLEPIRPNPLNNEALISFRIPTPGAVKLTVYNQLGQVVGNLANENLSEGLHEKKWYPGTLAPGTYIIHLESGGMISVRKALLTR